MQKIAGFKREAGLVDSGAGFDPIGRFKTIAGFKRVAVAGFETAAVYESRGGGLRTAKGEGGGFRTANGEGGGTVDDEAASGVSAVFEDLAFEDSTFEDSAFKDSAFNGGTRVAFDPDPDPEATTAAVARNGANVCPQWLQEPAARQSPAARPL